MKVRIFALLAPAAMLPMLAAAGHHSFGGTYDVNKKITIKGTMVQVQLRSPHSFFYVETKDEKGNVQRWAIEGAGAGQFAQQGVDSKAFRVGDPVEIIANPSRTASITRARLLKITRTTDGKTWGNAAAGEVVD